MVGEARDGVWWLRGFEGVLDAADGLLLEDVAGEEEDEGKDADHSRGEDNGDRRGG